MEKLFINIFQMSISASYLILAVLLIRFLLRKAPKDMRSFLWLLVGIRLLVPFSVESVFSLIPNTKTVDSYIFEVEQAELKTYSDTASVYAPVSQPFQDNFIPSAEKGMSKTQVIVLLCARIWLFGMALMLGYMLISWLRLKKRVEMSVPVDIALDCGHIKIYQSEMIESPFLFGVISPRIYIPSRIADEELPYVIQHEMTHRKRKDYLIKPIGFLLLSVYWFNPCVWIAYIMLCKDIELICDEKVIKQLGLSCKKEYSQALLNSAVNRRMIAACPVAFGEVGVKERVKNVLNYKKPAFWVLVAAVLVCIIVPVCFMTQKKPDASEGADAQEDANSEDIETVDINLDDVFTMAGEYEMLNPDPEQYYSAPRLNLDKDGTFSFSYSLISSYLPHGTYELKNDTLTAETDDGRYHYQFTRIGDFNNSILLFDTEHSSDVTNIDTKTNADVPIENGSVFIKNTTSAAIIAAREQSEALNQALAANAAMTAEVLQKKQIELEELKSRLVIEELKLQKQHEQAMELLDQKNKAALEARLQEMTQNLEASKRQLEDAQAACQSAVKAAEANQSAYEAIGQWAQAFCDRDAKTIIRLADENVEMQFVDRDFLDQGFDGKQNYASFGWSSPWPWGDNFDESVTARNYRIVSVTERSAEILYYAWTSDPHVTVWQEILTYKIENDKCIITSEILHFMDSICTADEFLQAYSGGITGTMMDYSFNGAGESLNKNAMANKSFKPYADLFAPDSAAIYLLNILNDPNKKVGTRVTKSDIDTDTCTVTFEFYEDGGTVDVQMIQPYGSDGIWIPHTSDLNDSDANIDVASIAPYIITGLNVGDIVKEDAKQLEALFPDHHEYAFNADFPRMVDLNGDGVEEKVEMIDLFYNGGDGGYALKITDTKTGKQIALPDGYTEESGFPIFSSYIRSEGEDPRLLIQLGEEKRCQTLATIMLDSLYYIYEQKNMYSEFKKAISNYSDEMVAADALSGCNIVTYNNEENPVILLKTYVSGLLGHIDTLGYVVTELRLQKDNTWVSRHHFLLDSWDGISVTQQEDEGVKEGSDASILPFDEKSDIKFLLLRPEKQKTNASE